MIRRILLGAAIIGASLSRLNCDLVFTVDVEVTRQPFLGCFKGAITEPATAGELTIVLEPPGPGIEDGGIVGGCMTATDPSFSASMTGQVLEDETQARFAVMPDGGRPSFVLLVTRQPEEGNATVLTLVNESNMPFQKADEVPRCATTVTCADLGLSQSFLPGSGS
jgi:hypothetical protein